MVAGFAALVVIIGLLGWIPIEFRWVLMMLLFGSFLAVLGRRVTGQKTDSGYTGGRWTGILIDNRFKMCLSRLQIILWTILALSAFAVIGLDRSMAVLQEKMPALSVLTGQSPASTSDKPLDALNIQFPNELLIALGISTTSLAGAAIIKVNKTEKKSNKTVMLLADQRKQAEDRLAKAKNDLKTAQDALTKIETDYNQNKAVAEGDPGFQKAQLEILRIEKERKPSAAQALKDAQTALDVAQQDMDEIQKGEDSAMGDVHTNDNIDQADWSDLFRGELVSNYQVVDVSKVQMFFVTIILIFTYGTLIWGLLHAEPTWQTAAVVGLPAFSESLVALLGISHAGYLVVKQTGS